MPIPMTKVAHHIDQGAVTMYAVDAAAAVSNHPDEWSNTPWPAADVAAWRSARDEAYKEELARYKEAVQAAKDAGLPPPPPLAPPPRPLIEPSARQKSEIELDTKARAEAAERVRVQTEEDEKKRIKDEQIAADKALLASPPPQPDPNERRPFGRSGPMTQAERDAAQKRTDAKAKGELQPEQQPDPKAGPSPKP